MDTATTDQWLADTRAFWDAGSEFEARYRRICASEPFVDSTDVQKLEALWDAETEAVLPRLTAGIPLQRDWVCLEIGCGVGRLMKPIAERCARVVGVDISPRMQTMSRSYLADVANAEVYVNDGCNLTGVSDQSIDFVYSHLAFQHLTLFEVVDSYLAEIRRVLRPGGYVRIQNWRDARKPMLESVKDIVRPILGRDRYRSSRCWIWRAGRNVKFGGVTFHPRAWRRRLQAHGFNVCSLEVGEGHDHWMWTTARSEA